MKQYIEGETYITYVRQHGLPASDPTSYHVRAECIGGNELDVGYFKDAQGNEFNSSSFTLESQFVFDRAITDVYPFTPNRVRKDNSQ